MKGFVFWMLLASGLGFLKLLALAYFMPAVEYGNYLALFGVSSLAGAFMSVGLTERSIKVYPRWWVNNHRLAIQVDAVRAIKIIGIRFVLLAMAGLALVFFTNTGFQAGKLAGFVGLGVVTGWLAQLASMYRAAGSAAALQRFALARGSGALVLALTGGGFWGWPGALGGDILASACITLWAWYDLRRLFRLIPLEPTSPENDSVLPFSAGHGRLYLANLLSSSMILLDRAMVGYVIGGAGAGSYGVVMLIPQVAQLLVNVIVQHIGPMIIKFIHLGRAVQGKIGMLNLQTILLGLFSFGLALLGLLAKRTHCCDVYFSKYDVSDLALVLAAVLAAGQIFAVVEWHLIAYDREVDVLLASGSAALFFVLLFIGVSISGAGVEGFVAAAAAARWWQVLILRIAYGRCKT